MADNENFRETTSNWFLVAGAVLLVGLGLLPVVIKVIQLISG